MKSSSTKKGYAVTPSQLQAEATAARSRVSEYSDEKRQNLETHARGVMQGAKSKVCSS